MPKTRTAIRIAVKPMVANPTWKSLSYWYARLSGLSSDYEDKKVSVSRPGNERSDYSPF